MIFIFYSSAIKTIFLQLQFFYKSFLFIIQSTEYFFEK
jgi:hypothetical protein